MNPISLWSSTTPLSLPHCATPPFHSLLPSLPPSFPLSCPPSSLLPPIPSLPPSFPLTLLLSLPPSLSPPFLSLPSSFPHSYFPLSFQPPFLPPLTSLLSRDRYSWAYWFWSVQSSVESYPVSITNRLVHRQSRQKVIQTCNRHCLLASLLSKFTYSSPHSVPKHTTAGERAESQQASHQTASHMEIEIISR